MSYRKLLPSLSLVIPAMMSTGIAAVSHADSNHSVAALEQESFGVYNYKVVAPGKTAAEKEQMAAKAAISFHAQLVETNVEEGYMIMSLKSDEVKKLKAFDFEVTLAPQVEEAPMAFAAMSMATATNSVSVAGIPNYSCYETVEETFAAAQAIVSQYPNLAEWIKVGSSTRGQDIRVLKLTNKNTSGNKPALFANSAIHAREYATAPLNLAFARHLVDGYGNDADATWILDHHEVHLMLQTNPDGRKEAEAQHTSPWQEGNMWRKNGNDNYCSSSSTSRGADLNRNFTEGWNVVPNDGGSSSNQCDFTYRGPSAGSEPEVQAIESYLKGLWPDGTPPTNSNPAPLTRSGIHIDIHSYSELVLWPWGHTSDSAPNGTELQTLGRKFAKFNGYMPQQSVGLYPTDGTSDGASYGALGVANYTFELGTSFRQSCSTFESTVKPDNLPALIYAAKVVRTPYITPAGPDATALSLSNNASTAGVTAGTPVTVSVSVTDLGFSTRNGTESTQNISAVEYYIGKAPWESGAVANSLTADDGSFNEKTEGASATINTTGMTLGNHIVYVRAKDTTGTWGAVSAVFLKIVDEVDPTDPVYCSASGDDASYEWISSVKVGSFTNTTGGAGYSDFTGQTVNVGTGSTAVTLTPGFRSTTYTEYWKIYVDLNKDGDFDDANEEVYASSGSKSEVTGNMSIPSSAEGTETRMRVVMRYNAAPSNGCGTFDYGEVEDYTIKIGEGGPDPDPTHFENTNSYDIPDNNSTGVSSPIDVTRSGAAGSVSVAVDITHTYKGDLIVDLVAPDGSVYNLHNRSGGSANNIKQTFTVDTGSEEANGTWNLRVRDLANQDVGTINSWSITFQ